MSKRLLILIAVACGTFMATLDSSIVNIALPTLKRSFQTNLVHTKWIVTSYFLVITCFLLPIGKMSDHFGHRNVFGFGFLIFTLGSVLCGTSDELNTLIFSRIVQAIGAAMLMANGPAIITKTYPPNRLGTALGTLAMSASVGLLSGPAIGGTLIMNFSWRSIFLVNIPIGIIGAFLVFKFVEADPKPKTKLKFDWPGTWIQMLILALFMELFEPFGLFQRDVVLPSISHGMVITIIIALIFLFIKVEKKALDRSIVDLSLIQNKTFWMANLSGFLLFVSYFSVSLLIPFYLEEIKDLSTDLTGRVMSAIPFTMLFIAPLSGRLSDLHGSRELCLLGAALSVLTYSILGGAIGSGLTEKTPISAIMLSLCLMGLSIGLFQSPNNNAIMGAVPKHKLGVASAMIATVRNLGLVTGAGLSTALFSWQHDLTKNYLVSMKFTIIMAAGVAVLSLIASLGKERGPHWR